MVQAVRTEGEERSFLLRPGVSLVSPSRELPALADQGASLKALGGWLARRVRLFGCVARRCCIGQHRKMSCKWSLLSTTVLVLTASAPGCADADGASPPTVASVDAPEPLTTDAGLDAPAEPVTTCCRLDNERGERLDYKCSTALSVPWFEERGYRCWLVQ